MTVTVGSAPSAATTSYDVARVSAVIRSRWVVAAATTSGAPPMVSAIRSETSRPASRRACWTARTRSRASPSAASSGVTAVSSTTKPPLRSTPVELASSVEPATVSRVYSPSCSTRPPAVTVPSAATDQSPDFEPLMAVCTSLPSRGPAARALTLSRCSTPYDAASADSDPSSRTSLTLTSSRTIASNPASAAGSSTTTVRVESGSRLRRLPALRSADVAEQTSRTWSIAVTRVSSAGSDSASGQSARCTERPPVSPRQTSSVASGISGAVTRQTISSTV